MAEELGPILRDGYPMSDLHRDPAPEKRRAGSSTGPRTPEGKSKSSENSTRHGCCSKKPLIKGESEEEFNELRQNWVDDYRPRNKSELLLVEQAVEAQWALRRNTNRYNDLEASLQERNALEWTEEEHKKMERFTRYRTTAERSFWRAANGVEQALMRRRKRVEERLTERKEAEREVVKAPEMRKATPETRDIETGAIHVLDQWVDVTIENGRAVTRLEPSNEQLFEDRETMEPPPEEVRRRFTFHDGVPEEYGWCGGLYEHVKGSTKYGVQQMTIRTWLAAIEREKATGTGHLSDTGEDLPDPKRRTWCWCTVCARTKEIGWKRERENEGPENQRSG